MRSIFMSSKHLVRDFWPRICSDPYHPRLSVANNAPVIMRQHFIEKNSGRHSELSNATFRTLAISRGRPVVFSLQGCQALNLNPSTLNEPTYSKGARS